MANPTRAPKKSPRSPAKPKSSSSAGKSAAKSAARPGIEAKKPKAGGAGGGKAGAVKAGKAAAPAKAAKPAKAARASKKATPAKAAAKKLPLVVTGKKPASPTARPDGVRKPASANGANGKSARGGADPTTAGLSPADAELVADLLPRLREICLSLPEATEVEAWGHPTFRVNDKIFASYGVEGARASMGVKTTPDMQSALVMSDPRFTVAAYVGKHGWVSLSLAGTVDLGEVEMLVKGSYRLIAPARLVRQLDELEG